jgi:hypothetical protein
MVVLLTQTTGPLSLAYTLSYPLEDLYNIAIAYTVTTSLPVASSCSFQSWGLKAQ